MFSGRGVLNMHVNNERSSSSWVSVACLGGLLSVFTALILYAAGNFTGVCWERFEILGHDKKVEIAVD